MAVLLPGKFIYLALPHTATRATARVLWEIDGAKTWGHKEIKNNHHVTKKELLEASPDAFMGNEIAVSTVRHPCDLLVTWWLRYLRYNGGGPGLLEFIQFSEKEITRFMPYLRDGKMYWIDSDEYMRYESLQTDLNNLLTRFGFPSVVLRKINVTKEKKAWQSYYDDEMPDVVHQRFGKEAERFNYKIRGML